MRRRMDSRSVRGAALVEFALAMLFLPLLAFGSVDFARVYQQQTKLRNAAREGASFAQFYPANIGPTTCPSSGSTQTIVARVTGADSSAGIATSDVSVLKNGAPIAQDTCSTTFAVGDRVTVRVSGAFTILTPLVTQITGTKTVTLTASDTVVVQR